MQGIVFDIKRFAVHDGPGIRTTVFLKGCPLKCFWCHNPESMDINPMYSVKKIKIDDQVFNHPEKVGIVSSIEDVMNIVRKDRIFMEESNGGVTFSGGEPTMQPAFLSQLLEACKAESLHTAVDTCGFVSQNILGDIIPLTDLFLFDFKHFNTDKHIKATGQSNKVIMKNLEFLLSNRKKVRIRIPIVPNFNYTEKDLLGMLAFLNSLPGNIEQVDLLPFHNIAQNKYKRFGIDNPMNGINSLKKEELQKTKEMFEEGGFKVKIGG